MGYYTAFSLNILGDKGELLEAPYEIEKAINERSGYDDCFDDAIKWYSYRKDCIEISKLYPYVIIVVTGEGEENFDKWREYFKNGMFQHTKGVVVYSEFDEDKFENYFAGENYA